MAHAAGGCLVGALQKQCEAGAIGAVVGEVVAELLPQPDINALSSEEYAKQRQLLVDKAKLATAVVMTTVGYDIADINTAVKSAETAVQNNGANPKIGAGKNAKLQICKNAGISASACDAYYQQKLDEHRQEALTATQNAITGAVDAATFGGTALIREKLDIKGNVNTDSLGYQGGDILSPNLFSKVRLPIKLGVQGGAHNKTSKPTNDGLDSHHCPAKHCYKDSLVSKEDGPAIKMSPSDHRLTASYGNSPQAIAYRQKQQNLLNQGKLAEAIQMDIDDIRLKFGDKYDVGIQQMLKYVETLNPNDFKSIKK